MKVILIGGYPGSGKSFVVKKLIKLLREKIKGDDFQLLQKYSMDYMLKRAKDRDIIVMGLYDERQKFPGTDRFGMNVQPLFEQFVREQKDDNTVIVLEGDRLFNGKTISFLWSAGIPYNIVIVQADKNLVHERRQKRSYQSETWRKGRETKVDNIAKQMPYATYINNNNEEQAEIGASRIWQLIRR